MRVSISDHSVQDPRTPHLWADYWVRVHLANAFRSLGHEIVPRDGDLNIYLSGFPFKHKGKGVNVVWFFSHPETMNQEVAEGYDMIFCSSPYYLPQMKEICPHRPVHLLICCTHCTPILDGSISLKYDLLFVANTRGQPGRPYKYGRRIVDDLDPIANNYDLALYGLRWNRYGTSQRFHKGEYWNNEGINELHAQAKMNLDDSRNEMMSNGFSTFRIFDIIGSGSLAVTRTKHVEQIFGDAVIYYDSPGELRRKVDYYLHHEEARLEKVRKGLWVMRKHTYWERAKTILEKVK